MFSRVAKSAALTSARRGIHTLVFVEDHSIITGNEKRLALAEKALSNIAKKVNADSSTVIKLNSGYFRPNEVTEYAKGAFDVQASVDLKGNKGASGLWGNIARVIKSREETEVNAVVVTNAADDASKHPLNGKYGMEALVSQLGEAKPGLRYTFYTVGLDVTREEERDSIRNACNWTGGNAVFLDCDGADADGTTICSAEAKAFFAEVSVTDAKKRQETVKAAKASFQENKHPRSPLFELTHITPTSA